MLEDAYLPHYMAPLGTDTSSWWWQEVNASSHTSRRTITFLNKPKIQLLTWSPCAPDLSPLDFHLRETALGARQFTSQLEWRAMIVRAMSNLDPDVAEKARTTRFIHRCLACVRWTAFDDQLTCTRFVSFDCEQSTRPQDVFKFWGFEAASALKIHAWSCAPATD